MKLVNHTNNIQGPRSLNQKTFLATLLIKFSLHVVSDIIHISLIK